MRILKEIPGQLISRKVLEKPEEKDIRNFTLSLQGTNIVHPLKYPFRGKSKHHSSLSGALRKITLKQVLCKKVYRSECQ